MICKLKLHIKTFKQYAVLLKAASVCLMVLFYITPTFMETSAYAQEVKQPKITRDVKIPRIAGSILQREAQPQRSPEYMLRHDKVREAMRMGRIVPLSQIRRAVLKEFSGKIIQVRLFELNNKKRPYIYNIRLITDDGELISVTFDATSAKILSVKGKS
jgi:uncharacterized membrane protein YkoI